MKKWLHNPTLHTFSDFPIGSNLKSEKVVEIQKFQPSRWPAALVCLCRGGRCRLQSSEEFGNFTAKSCKMGPTTSIPQWSSTFIGGILSQCFYLGLKKDGIYSKNIVEKFLPPLHYLLYNNLNSKSKINVFDSFSSVLQKVHSGMLYLKK